MLNGLEFQKSEIAGNQITLERVLPSPLRISVSLPDKQMTNLLIEAPELRTPIDTFIEEAKAALTAFETTWPVANRQILQSDATIRELYETTSQHAFQELWENRLGQSSKNLEIFGKPIRGGGLRFVLEPLNSEADPVQIEVKIESFLKDTSKIFLETQFIWGKPTIKFDLQSRLTAMNQFIESKIVGFISGENV